ncbi:MAG: hypothetical protein JW839_11325 [Candidatus Lokiarchaeota archaeon]|nr:hypothetical protein [Candidatus Lokiarchaeota archaeon]
MVTATLIRTEKASADDAYNAFSDLAFHGGTWWLAFRSGTGHVSPAGEIVVMCSADCSAWEQHARIEVQGVDLRDPKLFVSRGRLLVLAFSLDHHDPRFRRFRPADSYFFDVDGKEVARFSQGDHVDILWNAREVGGKVYATGYSFTDGHYRMRLWRAGGVEGPWDVVHAFEDDPLPLPPNLGFTEACIVPREGERMALFCRTDGDSLARLPKGLAPWWQAHRGYWKRKRAAGRCPGRQGGDWFVVGTAGAPYTRWDLKPHEMYLKGPAAIAMDGGFLVVGRHAGHGDRLKRVVLFHYDGEFHELLTLAGGNDGSYAGMAWHPERAGELVVSFYSDHERLGTPLAGKANDVWVSRIAVKS